jgi:Phage tail tube protein, GTA-gp10
MNPHKGDTELIVGSKQYMLRYSHSALVKLEKQLDKGLVQVLQEMSAPEQMRIGTIVAMLWAGLQKHQPTMSMDDAADLLDDIEGGTATVIATIDEAFRRAFNAPGTKGTNPPQTGNGVGMQSSSTTFPADIIPKNSGN